MSSLFLGWWSLGGALNTLMVLAHNLLGGFDLTKIILDVRTLDGECNWEKADVARGFQRRRFIVFLGILAVAVLIVAPLILFLLLEVVAPR